MISQGEVWWADLREPTGSGPGYRRHVVVAKESVANVSLIVGVDRRQLTECVSKLPRRPLEQVFAGIDIVLGR